MNKLLSLAVLSLLVQSPAFGQCGQCGNAAQAGYHSGTNLKAIKLQNTLGKPESLGMYLGNWPLALLVAGTDSASQVAAGVMQKVRGGASRSDPSLVAVVKSTPKSVAALGRKLSLKYTLLADEKGLTAAAFAGKAVPFVAFFDKTGRLVLVETELTELKMKAGMESALGRDKLTDPVCGMTVTRAGAAGSSEYQGKTYYFCSSACKQSFDKNPAQYLSD